MTYVMLYKTKVKPEKIERMKELSAQFFEIYKEHDIEVLGHWSRIDKPTTNYLMIQYASEADYASKVEKLKSDERYQSLSVELNQIREDFKMKRLVPTGVMS
ncbi:MAG: hypothetical protein ACFFED_07450 [Candidatus Thorarchaeota archaeon]